MSNPVVAPRLTFPIIRQWLDSSKDSSFITYEEGESHFNARAAEILINENLLTNLTSEEVVYIAESIISASAIEVINNTNFINRVLKDQHPVSFLMKLCNMKSRIFLKAIIRHEQLIGLFSNKEKMLLAFNHIEALKFFLENKEEAEKFSDQQLWELVENSDGIFLSIIIKNSLYDRFSNTRLKRFAEKWLRKGKLTIAQEKALRDANFRRNYPDLKNQLEKLSAPKPTIDSSERAEAKGQVAEEMELNSHSKKQMDIVPEILGDKPTKSIAENPADVIRVKKEVAEVQEEKILEPTLSRNAPQKKYPYVSKTVILHKRQPSHAKYIIPIILYSLLMLAGLTLIAMGVGFSFGIPLCIKASALMFGWAKVNLLISPILAGTVIEAAAVIPNVQKIMEFREELIIQQLSHYSTAPNSLSLKPFPLPATTHQRQSSSAILYAENDNQFGQISSLRTRYDFYQAKSTKPKERNFRGKQEIERLKLNSRR